MNKPQITIKDIARALNVSPSTVSRALKDNPDISQETRDLIHAYAREHNYKPNVLAVNPSCQPLEYDWCDCAAIGAPLLLVRAEWY